MGESDETTTSSRLPSEEIGRRGRDIYEREIRHQVEADHHGEIVAIDILSERVGYRGLASFGAVSLRRIR